MSLSDLTPKIAKKTIPYQGYFDVHVDNLESSCGKKVMTYTSLDLKVHAAAVLARTKEGKLIVTKEYRHPTKEWVWGCPGGRIDPGETPLQAGLRELKEEAGYTGTDCKFLGQVFALPAVTGQIIHYLFVDNAIASHDTEHESFEFIKIETKTVQEIRQAILCKEPIDSVLCTALFLAQNLLV